MSWQTEVILTIYFSVMVGSACVSFIVDYGDRGRVNILKGILIGIGWPFVALGFMVLGVLNVVHYCRGRLWVELAEIMPRATTPPLPQESSSEQYVVGQWRE